ncbi:DNA-binding transcriptional MerR regulator [Krasilnikovia cinnamomea]|uniref:DNA-binding transcriptional MerR regulator n=1 Tax=Krasilnikovia cinnamomea TaxID=349313 RepID=A0A4Q7ZN00_9ACTN|nr:MerR family transcriptional regulator [Krasilnikovia cinnamomea]RZU52397.1 DNA-binding transcriptional MerR regulator [Krasilnikovia cinnamomea]
MSSSYTPGETAHRTGFSLDTLRYYERIGLLAGVGRTPGGQRQYSDDDLGLLEVLRCLRETGMPIHRMREFADLCRAEDTITERIDLLEEHDRDVRQRIATLQSQRTRLREKIAYYRDAHS